MEFTSSTVNGRQMRYSWSSIFPICQTIWHAEINGSLSPLSFFFSFFLLLLRGKTPELEWIKWLTHRPRQHPPITDKTDTCHLVTSSILFSPSFSLFLFRLHLSTSRMWRRTKVVFRDRRPERQRGTGFFFVCVQFPTRNNKSSIPPVL